MTKQTLEETIDLMLFSATQNIQMFMTFLEFCNKTNGEHLTDFLQQLLQKASQLCTSYSEPSQKPHYEHAIDMLEEMHHICRSATHRMINTSPNVDDALKKRMSIYAEIVLNACNPNNYPFLNKAVIEKTYDTQGNNLRQGFENIIADLQKGSIQITDTSAFSVGQNLAVTPGKVIYRNDLIELIQYSPTTDTVYTTPLLIIPPWINKYYILDLEQQNSFVRWAVDHNLTVFMISWRNPHKQQEYVGIENYIFEGIHSALLQIAEQCQQKKINVLGYCMGGTLLAMYMAMRNNKQYQAESCEPIINKATFLTTLLNFEKAGDVGLFIHDMIHNQLESYAQKYGYINGKILFHAFSTLKSRDMIWNASVKRYMLTQPLPKNSLLFWNQDPMNISRAMITFLTKNLYHDNLLYKGQISIRNIPIHLEDIHKHQMYVIAMINDHLVPWKNTYENLKLFGPNAQFVLGGAGHTAGVINPPHQQKYCYWTHNDFSISAEQWLQQAKKISGSWWEHWLDWIQEPSTVVSRPILNGLYDAPGQYVMQNIYM